MKLILHFLSFSVSANNVDTKQTFNVDVLICIIYIFHWLIWSFFSQGIVKQYHLLQTVSKSVIAHYSTIGIRSNDSIAKTE